MTRHDVNRVTRYLEAGLAKERREAMGYIVATVLATPRFVIVGASLVA